MKFIRKVYIFFYDELIIMNKNISYLIKDIVSLYSTNANRFFVLLITGADSGNKNYQQYLNIENINDLLVDRSIIFVKDEIDYFVNRSDQPDNTYSTWFLAFLYIEGKYGLPIDHLKAFNLCSTAIKNGFIAANLTLGYMYYMGFGITRDYDIAFECFNQANRVGNMIATTELALIYNNCIYVTRDDKKMFKLLKKSAKANNLKAIYNLGLAYYHGIGVQKNHGKALQLFLKSVDYVDIDFKYIHDIIDSIFEKGEQIDVSIDIFREIDCHIIYKKQNIPEILKRLQNIDVVDI